MAARTTLTLALGLCLLATGAQAGERDITGFIIAPEGESSVAGIVVYACPVRPDSAAGGCLTLTINAETLFAPYMFVDLTDEDYYVYAIRDSDGSGDVEPGEYGAIYAGILDSYQKRATLMRPPRSNVTLRLRQYTGDAVSFYPGKAADGFSFENAALPVRVDQMTGTWEGGEYRGELVGPTSSESQYGNNRFVFGDDGRYTSSDVFHQLGECKVYASSGTYEFTADLLKLSVEESGLGGCDGSLAMTPSSGNQVEELAWRLMYYAESGLFLELIDPGRLTGHPGDWRYAKGYTRSVP